MHQIIWPLTRPTAHFLGFIFKNLLTKKAPPSDISDLFFFIINGPRHSVVLSEESHRAGAEKWPLLCSFSTFAASSKTGSGCEDHARYQCHATVLWLRTQEGVPEMFADTVQSARGGMSSTNDLIKVFYNVKAKLSKPVSRKTDSNIKCHCQANGTLAYHHVTVKHYFSLL